MNNDTLDAAILSATFDPEARSLMSFGEVKALAVEIKTLRRKLRVEVEHSATKSALIAKQQDIIEIFDELHWMVEGTPKWFQLENQLAALRNEPIPFPEITTDYGRIIRP